MFAFAAEELNSKSQSIHDHAIATAKKYLIAEADLLTAIIHVDQDQTFKKLGFEHLTPYCVRELKLSEEVAGTFVRVARKSRQVPQLVEAVDAGLELTKAKTIASVITPDNQLEWIERAKTLSKANLEKEIAREIPKPLKPEKAKAVGEDRHRIEFEVDDATMIMQKRAMDLVSGKLRKNASLGQTQSYLLKHFLKHEDPVVKAERSRERSKTKNKSVPAHVKHEVYKRDQGCCQAQNPDGTKCNQTRWVDLHHVQPKAAGGSDTLENLITLCSSHHRLWHERMG